MKNTYPDYRRTGTAFLENQLNEREREILEAFITYCGVSAGDLKVRARRAEVLHARDVIEKPFDTWTLEDLRGFLAALKRSGRRPWTVKGILITLQMFLKWQYKDWSERFNNLEDLRKLSRLTRPNNADRYNESTLPTAEEIDRVIRKARCTRDKLYVAMAAEAGLPPKVQRTLRWSNVRIDSPKPGVSTLEYFRTKNSEGFVFPLVATATYYLKRWRQEYEYPDLRGDDFIFPSPVDRSKPLAHQTAWYMLNRLGKKAGLTKPLYQYLLRHRALSEAYQHFPEEVHRRLFGHTKGSVQTRTYSHGADKQKVVQIALEKLHQVDSMESATPSTSVADETGLLKNELRQVQLALAGFRKELQSLKRKAT